ncbi:MAG: polyprenyl synthetase family protein [Gemmatimonadota bacterium]|nr:MAG: polyprenyl synthetase family protein [Gemmatimonadota bacterium]
MYDFDSYLEETQRLVNRALTAVLDDYLDGVSDWLTEPIRYACEGGGKRFRPILFLAAYEVGGRLPDDRVRRLASALEIVHAYSLVHDDLPCMDDDDWRRGRPTCHRAFGAERATIAAAAMVPLASWVVAAEAEALGLSGEQSATLVAELSEAAGPTGMVGGQVLDLINEGRAVSSDELVDIHRRKTGALIRAAARLGGRVGRLEPRVLGAVTEYGERVGLAFQIADDLLDEEGTTATIGKDAHSDREHGKATYPGVFGLEGARAEALRLADEAIMALRRAGIDSPALEGLAIHVVERES